MTLRQIFADAPGQSSVVGKHGDHARPMPPPKSDQLLSAKILPDALSQEGEKKKSLAIAKSRTKSAL